jgi:hypothetical protein
MTNNNLLLEIEKIVASNLPSLQASAFKQYIEEAEKNKHDCLVKAHLIEKLQINEQKLIDKIKILEESNKEFAKIESDLVKFWEDKRQFELDKLKFEVEKSLLLKDISCADDKAALTERLFSIAFKNPEFKTSVLKQHPIVCRNQNGEWYYGENVNICETKETVSKTIE